MINGDEIVITMTSYPARITTVSKVVYSILRNTLKPDRFVLNLSELEFKNKEYDLPMDLRLLLYNSLIEIIWHKDNKKQFKKLIPTLEKYPDSVVISIDDDVYYPIDFVETMYSDYLKYDKKYPITGGRWIDKKYFYNKPSHHGSFTLITKSMFGNKFVEMKRLIKKELWKNLWFDDPLYTAAIVANGLEYKFSEFNGYKYKKQFKTEGVSSENKDKRIIEYKFLMENLCK
jgi:hypothetical protein